jgi:hypothetical protein
MMIALQNEQQKILRLLGRVQFASIDLIHKMTATERKPRSTYYLLHEIENKTGLITHKVFYTKNKQALGTSYALTSSGAAYVAELEGWDIDSVYFPQGGIGYEFQDHFHREACALFLAYFWRWIEAAPDTAVSRWSAYWKKADGSRYPTNRVEVKGLERPIIPDWVLRFQHGEKGRLVAVEIDRTTGRARLLERVQQYAQAIDTQAISDRFNHPRAPFVLLVTETNERMAQLVEDIQAGKAGRTFIQDYFANFHLSTLPELEKHGLAGAFSMLDGSCSPLFPETDI